MLLGEIGISINIKKQLKYPLCKLITKVKTYFMLFLRYLLVFLRHELGDKTESLTFDFFEDKIHGFCARRELNNRSGGYR
jgi:hypothetical protein